MTTTKTDTGKRRLYNRRGFLLTVSVTLFAATVSAPFQTLSTRLNMSQLVSLQAVQFLLILIAGMLPALLFANRILQAAKTITKALLQTASDAERQSYLRLVASIVIIFGMFASFVWTSTTVNAFVELHRGVLVESDLLVYLMGLLTAAAWSILLEDRVWYGLLFTPTLAMMTIANILTKHSW
ncbi:MAG: hypothetical protein ACYCYO_06200 [Bacilli bacterium]